MPKILYPTINWGGVGKGGHPKGVQKDSNGRYKIAVGPQILDSDYPDSGKIQVGEFDFFNKKIDVYLTHKTTGEKKIISCVVEDLKAHSYNKYPDGQPYNRSCII